MYNFQILKNTSKPKTEYVKQRAKITPIQCSSYIDDLLSIENLVLSPPKGWAASVGAHSLKTKHYIDFAGIYTEVHGKFDHETSIEELRQSTPLKDIPAFDEFINYWKKLTS